MKKYFKSVEMGLSNEELSIYSIDLYAYIFNKFCQLCRNNMQIGSTFAR